MNKLKWIKIPASLFALAASAVLLTAIMVAVGCSSVSGPVSTISPLTPTTAVAISITDAPSDWVIATNLTLNSIVLTDSAGKTASILPAPITFEAAHLSAVQEPLFTPKIPEDTYTSVALTYSGAEVAYIDPTTKQLVIGAATLANTSQTVTFSSPITVSNSSTALLIDYLVSKSISLSGSTLTVTPTFSVSAITTHHDPTNGTNGRQDGVKGAVTAIASNNFTMTNSSGSSLVIYVDSSTRYEHLTGFSALAVGDLVEVDTATQTDGTLLALRVEMEASPDAADGSKPRMLVGPIIALTGSPVTSFTEVVRQDIDSTTPSAPAAEVTVTVTPSTTFGLPGRFGDLFGDSLPITPAFSAAILFPGQNVSVAAPGVTNGAATATKIMLSPQTIGGTVANISSVGGGFTAYTVTLVSDSWLATLTGKTSVTVYSNGNEQDISNNSIAVGSSARFNGFLFNNNGSLVLLADVRADGQGNPIGGDSGH